MNARLSEEIVHLQRDCHEPDHGSRGRPGDDVNDEIASLLGNSIQLPPGAVANVTVGTRDAIVEVRGVTSTESARAAIEAIVMTVRGVRNHLQSLEALAASVIRLSGDETTCRLPRERWLIGGSRGHQSADQGSVPVRALRSAGRGDRLTPGKDKRVLTVLEEVRDPLRRS
ncbi:MAG: hypothetical protein ABI222_10050 [Opitutaceae bacterium]